jgi:hypothetical protein
MYTSRQFAPDKMKAWEENNENDKNDWDFIVNYFSTKNQQVPPEQRQ